MSCLYVGKHASRPAFDTLLQAAGGLISVTGHAGHGQQVRVGVSIIDICSGLYTLSGKYSGHISYTATHCNIHLNAMRY